MKLLERPLDVAAFEPRQPPEAIIPEARQREKRRRLRIGLVILTALTIAGTVGGVVGSGGGHMPTGPTTPPKNLPSVDAKALAHTTVFLWPPGRLPATTPWPSQPLINVTPVVVEHVATGHLSVRVLPSSAARETILDVGRYLVYNGSHGVFALANDFKGRVRLLGSATSFVPSASPDQVWLVRNDGIQTVSVTSGRLGPVVSLPHDAGILRGTDVGLLLLTRAGVLELWRPGSTPRVVGDVGELGAGALFAADARLLAYGSGCRFVKATPGNYEYTVCTTLRVVDLFNGKGRSFAAPDGTVGWAPLGLGTGYVRDAGFSLGGAKLAAEAVVTPARKARTEEVILSVIAQRRQIVTRVPSWNAQLYGRTAWSPDGASLFYQGLHNRLDVFLPDQNSWYQSKLPCCRFAVGMFAVTRAR